MIPTKFSYVKRNVVFSFVSLFALAVIFGDSAHGAEPEKLEKVSWYEKVPGLWSGHFKAQGKVSFPEERTLTGIQGADTMVDGGAEIRLKNETGFNSKIRFTAHYEVLYSAGDSLVGKEELSSRLQQVPEGLNLTEKMVSDKRRLMDLTGVLDEDRKHILYHRLDRFFLSYNPVWGNIRVGRQALTWGNGRIFNPMDLFNPFSPSDVERDYKIGDDMLSLEVYPSRGALQFIYVPRRDPDTGKISGDHSSFAGRYNLMGGTLEFDTMAGYHYGEVVLGLGLSGYLGNAAWRADGVVTFLENGYASRYAYMNKDKGLALVANMDYSWVWKGKNFYGLVEFYYNSLLENSYARDILKPWVSERMARGELYTLGNTFLAGTLRFEAHPLLNLYLTAINNLSDPSGIIQPRIIFDAVENIQIKAGVDLFWGARGTEFGGWKVPGTGLSYSPSNTAYITITRFF